MAKLHRRYPDLNSNQIESLMKQTLTHTLDHGNGGQVAVLDYKESFELLHGGTF